jgi:hypothetical protein
MAMWPFDHPSEQSQFCSVQEKAHQECVSTALLPFLLPLGQTTLKQLRAMRLKAASS